LNFDHEALVIGLGKKNLLVFNNVGVRLVVPAADPLIVEFNEHFLNLFHDGVIDFFVNLFNGLNIASNYIGVNFTTNRFLLFSLIFLLCWLGQLACFEEGLHLFWEALVFYPLPSSLGWSLFFICVEQKVILSLLGLWSLNNGRGLFCSLTTG